jgi:tetratricopeptide (TPR) repeat protein
VAFFATVAGCAAAPHSVVRVTGTRETSGRFIPPEAYAAFALGVVYEARGDLGRAKAAFTRALDEDPESPEIRTRIASIDCRTGKQDVAAVFAPIFESEATYARAHLEAARCHLERSETKAALKEALLAAALEPGDPNATDVVASIFERRGATDSADHWRRARSLYGSPSIARAERAARAEPTRASVETALSNGDLQRARRLAVSANIPSGELAAIAAARGKPDLAREQAAMVLGADPENGDAWIARVAAAELDRDDEALRAAVRDAPTTLESMSPTGTRLMGALLARVVGDRAASAWLAAAAAAQSAEAEDAGAAEPAAAEAPPP